MNKIVGVTGATGKIGRVLVDQLLEKKYGLKVMIRKGSKNPWKGNNNVEVIVGDVTNVADLEKLVSSCDYVVHLAVVMDLSLPWEVFEKVNIKSVEDIIHVTDKKTKLIIASSVTVFKDTGKSLRGEGWDLKPRTLNDNYAKSKIEALKVIRKSRRKVVTVMPSIVVDKKSFGREEAALSSPLREWIWRHVGGGIPGGIMAAVGDKNRVIAMIEVDDVARGIILAMEKGRVGEEYILTGQNIGAYEYLQKMGAKLGKNYLRFRIPTLFLKFFGLAPLSNMNFSGEKARKNLGFVPEWKL